MPANSLLDGSGTFWWIRSACYCWSSFIRLAFKIATVLASCAPLANRFCKLKKIWADSGYAEALRDYECLPETSEAFIRIAMIRLILTRLT